MLKTAIWRASAKRHSGKLVSLAAVAAALATIARCLPLGIAGALGAFGLNFYLESERNWFIGLAVLSWGLESISYIGSVEPADEPA